MKAKAGLRVNENHHLRIKERACWSLRVKIQHPDGRKAGVLNVSLKTKDVELARRRRDRLLGAMDAAGYLPPARVRSGG